MNFVFAVVCAFGMLSSAPKCAAQDHPAFAAPPGFQVQTPSADGVRTFSRAMPNGDRLRIVVATAESGAEAQALAKTKAAEPTDSVLEETRQEISVGTLRGIAYSCVGAGESVDGLPFTRYRRVMGFALQGSAPFSVRADLLAKEPRPAQSSLEAMSKALADWYSALGGGDAPKSDAGAAPPAVGGERLVKLTGGGDMEFRVPAAWAERELDMGEGRTTLFLGPARDVLKELTVDSLAKDKDRFGPYMSVDRVRREAFNDLIDLQLLDIADSLLADYAAQQEEAGVTLTLGERDEGTLGTRVVISVPFEESRKSGTKHKGRLVAMLHRGVLVLATASHPLEGYEQGWEALAKALDTLLFTGAPEADPAAPAASTRPSPEPASPNAESPSEAPEAAPRASAGAFRLAASPVAWSSAGPRSDLRTALIPLSTPLTFAYPAAWTLYGDDAAPERGELLFVAAASSSDATDPLRSSAKIEYRAFREELTWGDGSARLLRMLSLKLRREAAAAGLILEIKSEERAANASGESVFVRYVLSATSEARASGTAVGVHADGTSVVFDLRLGDRDSSLADAAAVAVGSLRLDAAYRYETRAAGPFAVQVPADWTFSTDSNRASGFDAFLRAPSGLDLRIQTAWQARPQVFTYDVLRKVSSGFLVDGLRVLDAREFQASRRHEQAGARVALRFASNGPDLDALVLAGLFGDQLAFALRAAPVAYRGRDLAVAWRVMRALSRADGSDGPGASPPAIRGANFVERVVYERVEWDEFSADGWAREPSSRYVAFLPDGTAGVVVEEPGRRRDLRGAYRIDGDVVTLECGPLGTPQIFRLSADGESLEGERSEALFRSRRLEFP